MLLFSGFPIGVECGLCFLVGIRTWAGRHFSRGRLPNHCARLEKAAGLFVWQPVGNGPSRSTRKHNPTTKLRLLSPTGCQDFAQAIELCDQCIPNFALLLQGRNQMGH